MISKTSSCALGITVDCGVIELYGVNELNQVLLHGWFDHETGLTIIKDRPACLISVEEGGLPDSFLAALESLGHSLFIIPAVSSPFRKRQARECCEIAMGWMSIASQAPDAFMQQACAAPEASRI